MIWDSIKLILLLGLGYLLFKIALLYRRQRELEAMGVKFSPYFPIITDIFRVIYYATYYPNKMSFTEIIE